MHGGWKPDSDSRQIYAQRAETRLKTKAHLCTVYRDMTQIQGTLMHGGHYLPQDSRQRIKNTNWYGDTDQ